MSFTPGPWKIGSDDWQPWEGAVQIIGADGETVCFTATNGHETLDAELICRAVNAFDSMKVALTDALRSTRKDFKAGPDGDRQHREAYSEQFAALSKAEGHIGQELAPDPERRVNGNANGDEG